MTETSPTSPPATATSRTIKSLSPQDRPREKLYAHGETALTTAELLAILIGSGTPQRSAVDLMQDVLRDCDDKLLLLSRMGIDELMQYNGIGEAKAITIRAAMELGRRRSTEETMHDLKQMTDAQSVYRYMHPIMRDLPHEECWSLMLNSSARLIRRVRISQGGITETAVDIRLLMKQAILCGATSIILTHNHPSGSCRPSHADEQLTQRARKACDTLNIHFLDHIVVTDGDSYSFAENGRL